eukprot:CAMPEP_0174263988 /NCGR_PEP_ID=MMETSP0439-20130205/20873_1 /TAXON_ID=0 /ORGANISM="Stereomyxa ramosa, Strain Chinc5" /LENGTH=252 /DNA_ID=CAMNT_0015349653 /DNA_START=1293 /DNA_END=2051 /DNA_ORIENTATION=+
MQQQQTLADSPECGGPFSGLLKMATANEQNMHSLMVEDVNKPFSILSVVGEIKLSMCNDPFCELYGYTRDELLHKDIKMLMPDWQWQLCKNTFQMSNPLNTTQNFEFVMNNLRKDGESFVTNTKYQMFYAKGKMSWGVMYIENIDTGKSGSTELNREEDPEVLEPIQKLMKGLSLNSLTQFLLSEDSQEKRIIEELDSLPQPMQMSNSGSGLQSMLLSTSSGTVQLKPLISTSLEKELNAFLSCSDDESDGY